MINNSGFWVRMKTFTVQHSPLQTQFTTVHSLCDQSGATVSHWPVTLNSLHLDTCTGRNGVNCNHLTLLDFEPRRSCVQFGLDPSEECVGKKKNSLKYHKLDFPSVHPKNTLSNIFFNVAQSVCWIRKSHLAPFNLFHSNCKKKEKRKRRGLRCFQDTWF